MFERGRFTAATHLLKRALGRGENESLTLLYLALSLYEEGKFCEALRYLEKRKGLDPSLRYTHLNMGCAYEKLRQNRLAIHNYKQELRINPLCSEAMFNLGNLYYELKRYKEAASFLERSYSLRHSVAETVERLAYSYFKAGLLEKEIKLYEDCLRLDPKNPWYLKNLGAALSEAGEQNRALLYLKKAAKLEPTDKLVNKNIRRVLLARHRNGRGAATTATGISPSTPARPTTR